MIPTQVNYKNIAVCIANEVMPVERALSDEREKLLLAVEVLSEHGLLNEYRRQRRKQILRGILL